MSRGDVNRSLDKALSKIDLEILSSLEDSSKVGMDLYDRLWLTDMKERRLYLYGEIAGLDEMNSPSEASMVDDLVNFIMRFNREDFKKPAEDRRPIMLYINSPGGDVVEGFSLISAILTSKTPVYTVNLGQWSSMSFLIGIAGKKRFSLPYATFLLHDGSVVNFGSAAKVQDKADFDRRFEREVVRQHVLKHSKMSETEYDALLRVEYYMLPEDAKRHGFIDEIVTDLDQILGLQPDEPDPQQRLEV